MNDSSTQTEGSLLPAASEPLSLDSIVILNVDDNEVGRYSVTRMLQRVGFSVREATTGEDAISCALDSPPHLILLDVNLPDYSGFEVCRRLKENDRTAAVPVLMISASFIRDKDRVKGLDGGADGYLAGPLEPEVLVATIRALLRAREAEDALRWSTQQWQSTFDSITDPIAIIDAEGVVVRGNDAWRNLVGLDDGEKAVGRPLASIVAGTDAAQMADALPSADTADLHEHDLQLGERWFRLNYDSIVDQGDTPGGHVLVLSDITERKRFERELEQSKERAESANRAKDQFLAVLSHELRTPLTPVLTAVQALSEETGISATAQECIDVIARNVELEARLIDDLLDLTRIARGKLQLNLDTVDAHVLMTNVIDICREEISAKRLDLNVELLATRHHVRVDPARLQQVFWNLIKNAVKFTPDRGRLSIRSRNVESGDIAIEFVDSGIGIDPEILPRIFNAFEQGERRIAQQFGGLGLGLAISRTLMEIHGGQITASSDGANAGATFTVTLGTSRMEQEETTEQKKQTTPEDGDRKVHILIVEDHADTGRVMQLLLERNGYRVTTAHSMQSALAAADGSSFDLVISDIGLPDGTGLELMGELRSRGEVLGIAMSGFGMEEDVRRSLEAGFVEHLTKPVSFKKLHEVVRRLTEG